MLLDDFFYIEKIENEGSQLKAYVNINKEHKIFQGHFPAVPIVPGVCMMQMMREIMEQQSNRKLIIRSGDNMKFLSVINPTVNSELQADIQYEEGVDGSFKINATLLAGTVVFFKIKATLSAA